jgi:hypothetical protein
MLHNIATGCTCNNIVVIVILKTDRRNLMPVAFLGSLWSGSVHKLKSYFEKSSLTIEVFVCSIIPFSM